LGLELAEVVGHLATMNRFPVEPLGGESSDAALLRSGGLVGDRVNTIYDAESNRPVTVDAAPQLLLFSVRYVEDLVADEFERWSRVKTPSGKEYLLTDLGWLAEAESAVGRRLRLAPGTGDAESPILLISRPTLRLAERTYGAPLERQRLRANLIIEIPEGKAFDENGWIGRRIRIGDALLEITGGSKDSVATYASGQGEGDPSLLAGLATLRGGHLGVVARAVEGHRLRTGDPVVLLS
jgi:uncharacterized protein YcbX